MFKKHHLILVNQIRYQSINTNTSGINGTNRFLNRSTSSNTSMLITDPCIVYKNLIQNKKINSDPFQLALVKKLSNLSKVLQDYEPDLTNIKINKYIRDLEIRLNENSNRGKFYNYTIGVYKERENLKSKKQLIKVLNDFEELATDEMKKIPKGLLINGEVGCGKSMIIDLFADSLPIKNKLRIHWNVFIQLIMKEIELISINKRNLNEQLNHSILNYENQFILFKVASNLVEKFHILIIDEFMLPDIASAKIINSLFIYYFKLGGVLITTSNKLPEDLYSGSINKNSISDFEKILRLRCDVWNMQSEKDYRIELNNNDLINDADQWLILKNDPEFKTKWNNLVNQFIDLQNCNSNQPILKSYGRDIIIPKFSGNVVYFEFDDIIKDSSYGPSDFISICSKFEYIIINNVPILTVKMKSNARKLINFIDAMYDSKCKLIISLETDLNNIFFPDKRIKDDTPTRFECTPLEDGPNPICLPHSTNHDVQDIEMFTDTELDLLNPHRPNFATYEDNNKEFNEKIESTKNLTDVKKFTGNDEMFAYKRAVSRIYEMTHSIKWRNNPWIPLHENIRSWEKSLDSPTVNVDAFADSKVEHASDDDSNPSLLQDMNAPKFKDYNFWSMGKWDNKESKLNDEIAKKWIKGVNVEK